jgi:parvulin-like peptidyl-prolyl isomerase
MLDLFRKRGAMSVVYGGLMGAVIVVFLIQFRSGAGAGNPLGGLSKTCVAKVRGQCIEDKQWRAQKYLLHGASEQAPQLNYNKAAMDSLVERALLEQEAQRLGLRVTEDDVMQEIIRDKVHVYVPVAMRAQSRQLGVNELGFRWTQFGTKEKPFDQAIFEKVVSATTGQPVAEFVDAQQEELLANRVVELVAERVRISDAEAWDQYVAEKSTSTIRYVRFNPTYFGSTMVPLDTASIDKWAAEHVADVEAKEKSMPPDQEKRLLHPRHILIDSKKDDAPEKKAEAKKKAEDLLAQVKAGADFAKLAKDNSSDPGSKDKGGEYDWTSGYEYVPEFRDALGKLKVGESGIVETQYGFHVIQLLGRMDGKTAVAYPLYVEAKGEELAKTASERLAEALKGKIPVQLDDTLKPKVEEAKKAGKNDADATAQVLDDEARNRMSKALDDVLAAMAPKVETKADDKKPAPGAKPDDKKPAETPAPLAAWQTDERRPHVEESSPFAVNGSPIIGLMDQQVIVDGAGKLTKEAPIGPALKAGTDWFLVALKDRHEATKTEFDKDRTLYVGQMLGKKRDDAIVNYVNGLRDSLGKDLWIDPKYVSDDKKAAAPGEAPPPEEDLP